MGSLMPLVFLDPPGDLPINLTGSAGYGTGFVKEVMGLLGLMMVVYGD